MPTTDWERIHSEYVTGEISLRDVADRHGVPRSQVFERSSAEGWVHHRREWRRSTAKRAEEAAAIDYASLFRRLATHTLHVAIPGRPPTKRDKDWRTSIGQAAKQALGAREPSHNQHFVCLIFHIPGHEPRRDLDNMIKAVLDALTGVVWIDDHLVFGILAFKFHDHLDPGLEILVFEIQGTGVGGALWPQR